MIRAIVHADKEWGIGKNNDLLFSIPKDMKFFRETTTGKTVIMGRATLESFPNQKPLPKRRNIVITGNSDYEKEGAEIVHSVEEAAALADSDAFVIGGSSIYRQMLDYCVTAYVTKVKADGNADCFFPDLDEDCNFELVYQSDPVEDNGYELTFCTYKRCTDR